MREIKTSILSSYLEACISLDLDTFHSFCSLFLNIFFFISGFEPEVSVLDLWSFMKTTKQQQNKNKKTLAFSSYKQVSINIDSSSEIIDY